jgi:hypothetical protein
MAEGKSFLTHKNIIPICFSSYAVGNVSYYPIEDFVRGSNYGVISVGIQYRLGALGEL